VSELLLEADAMTVFAGGPSPQLTRSYTTRWDSTDVAG
jgi:hypothetical protein